MNEIARSQVGAPVGISGGLKQLRALVAGRVGSGVLLLVAAVVLLGVVLPKVVANGPGFFIQILSFGVADGAIFALIALGYTVVYWIIELINFAHGDVFTLGAFISLTLLSVLGLGDGSQGVTVWLGLLGVFVVTMLVMGLINITIERVAYRPLRSAPRLATLITAVGMSFILEGVMYLWRGAINIHYPDLLPHTSIPLGAGASVGLKDVMVIVAAVTLVALFTLFVSFSRLGKSMRATAQDRDAAQLMGIDINRAISAAFFLGAVLAGAGGIIFGLYFNSIRFDLGFQAGLIAFTAAVFGGIGNIQGAALGGLLIGIIQAFNNAYFDSAWTDVIIFWILILVLVFRPSGLLGMQVPEK
jgi:branched-chain amino acid transport system permease protein